MPNLNHTNRTPLEGIALPADALAIPLRRFAALAGISVSTAYREVAAGRLELRKVGTRSVVPTTSARAWLDNLPRATITQAG